MIPVQHFLIISIILFCIGVMVVLTKKNAILILIGIELILNAANINLIAFSRYDNSMLQGQVFSLFVMVIAVAEAAIALAIIYQVYKQFSTSNPDEVSNLKG